MTLSTLIPKKKKTPPRKAALPKPEVYAPKLVPSQHPVPRRVLQKLNGLRRKYRGVNLGIAVSRGVAVLVMLLTTQMFVDWLVDLPFLARAALQAMDIWLLVYFLRKQFFPLLLRPPDVEACALMVEKKWGRFKGRMIATVQFAKPRFTPVSPELVDALHQETEARMITADFGEIVSAKPLRRYFGAALLLAAIWIFLFITFRPGTVALLERVFLLPAKVPRKTEVIVLSGNKVIPAGDSVLIEAEARGIIPSHGRVTLVDDSGKIQEVTLEPERDHADRFSLKLESVPEPLSYTIRLNDATSDTYTITTIPRPNILTIDCEQTYPPYTGLGTVKRTVENLALLAGSHLKIHATTNGKIVKAALKLAGIDKTLPVKINGADGKDLTGEFDIPASGLIGFSIQLTNEAGVTSGDDTQYRIDLIPDHPPSIQVTYPQRLQELYTLQAKPTIAFVAGDDYGLAKVSLCYRIIQDQDAGDATATAEPKKIEMDLGKEQPLKLQRRYEWDLATMQPPLTEGTLLEYWMEAEDGNNVTGPGRSESEHHTIKIVSEMEKKEEVMNRLMDSLNTITDLSASQQKLNEGLGDLIQGKNQNQKNSK